MGFSGRMKSTILFAIAGAAALVVHAEGPSPAPSPAAVSVEVSSSALRVTNGSGQGVCYAVHEARQSTLIEWGPVCSDTNRIAPHATVRIPIRPGQFAPSGEAIVSWWVEGANTVAGHLRLKIPLDGRPTGRGT